MCQSYLNYKLQPPQLGLNIRIKFCRHVFSHTKWHHLCSTMGSTLTPFLWRDILIFMYIPNIWGGVLKYFFIFKKSPVKRQGRNENKNTLSDRISTHWVPSYKLNSQLRKLYLQNRCSQVFEFIICFEEFLGHFVISIIWQILYRANTIFVIYRVSH